MLLKRKAPVRDPAFNCHKFDRLQFNKKDNCQSKIITRSPIKKNKSKNLLAEKKIASPKLQSKLNVEKTEDDDDEEVDVSSTFDNDASKINISDHQQKSSDTVPESVDLDQNINSETTDPIKEEPNSRQFHMDGEKFNETFDSVMELVNDKTPQSTYNLYFANRQRTVVDDSRNLGNQNSKCKPKQKKTDEKSKPVTSEAGPSHEHKIPNCVNDDDNSQCVAVQKYFDSGSERDVHDLDDNLDFISHQGINQTLKERLNLKSSKLNSKKIKKSVLHDNYQSFIYGTWVECGKCYKWRYLTDVLDPSTLDEDWQCRMEGPDKNCSLPQVDLGRVDDFAIFNKFTVGSLVWAKVDGFCWWPAMVDIDPDENCYFMLEALTDEVADYHVTFLDKCVSRAWVDSNCGIRTFTGPEDRKSMNLIVRNKNYTKQIFQALENAEIAKEQLLDKRLETFGFLYRYDGKPNIWTHNSAEVPNSMKNKNYLGKGRLPKSNENADLNQKKRKELEMRIKKLQKESKRLEQISKMSLSQSQTQSSQSQETNGVTKTKEKLLQQKKQHGLNERRYKRQITTPRKALIKRATPASLEGSAYSLKAKSKNCGKAKNQLAKTNSHASKSPSISPFNKSSKTRMDSTTLNSISSDETSGQSKQKAMNKSDVCQQSDLAAEETVDIDQTVLDAPETTLNETNNSLAGTIFSDLYCYPKDDETVNHSTRSKKLTKVVNKAIAGRSDQESSQISSSDESVKSQVSKNCKSENEGTKKRILKRKCKPSVDLESTDESETESLKLMRRMCHQAVNESASKKKLESVSRKNGSKNLAKIPEVSAKKSRSSSVENKEPYLSQSSLPSPRSTRSIKSNSQLVNNSTVNAVPNLSQTSTRSNQSKNSELVKMAMGLSEASGTENESKINLPKRAMENSPIQKSDRLRGKKMNNKVELRKLSQSNISKGMTFNLRGQRNKHSAYDSDPIEVEL